jgi:hypothetical protein
MACALRPCRSVYDGAMHPIGTQPTVQVQNSDDYRDNYANSVQVRASLWDFFLLFGTVQQASPEEVNVKNYQGVYLSPQQAKALSNVLAQNIQQYEATFGEINLQPQGGEPRVLQ